MSFLESAVNQCFKKAADGSTLFFPFCQWGKGYVVSTLEKENELKVSLRRTIIIFIVISVIASRLIINNGLVYFPIFLSLTYLLYYIYIRASIRSFQESKEKLTASERNDNESLNLSKGNLLHRCISCAVLVGIGVWLVYTKKNPWYGGFSIIGFSYMFIVSLRQYLKKG